ncbi:MAG: glycosyltransferase family 4 protein [Myxococcota bacterium]|nr:glycosyltransferase family 4 protein [Myxococcota bacterium]MDW8363107.1 glycosyltransferase family 4 protein [Myxococcales bacterium]
MALRVLAAVMAPVPGSASHGAALLGMGAALHADIDVVSSRRPGLAHAERRGNVRLLRVPEAGGTAEEARQAFVRALCRQIDAQVYDVLHLRGPFFEAIAHARRGPSPPRILYEVATFPDESEGAHAETLWNEAHERCLDAADLILVPTLAAARSLEERGWGGKTAVVRPGVDVNRFDWWPAATDEVHRLLFLGNFAADRDLGTVLTAVRSLVSRGRKLRVLLAGEPDASRRERTRRLVTSFDLADVVEVRGEPVPGAVATVVAAADVCIVPAAPVPRFQDHGDLPEPLLEYFACKRPVVAAGVPGVGEVLQDDREGLLYPPGDESALADAIATLLDDAALRQRLVDAAYARVRFELSESARRRRIAEVYEMLMPGSQLFDAWSGSFERDSSVIVALDDTGSHPVVEESSTDAIALLSDSELNAVRDSSPETTTTPGEDTSPGISAFETDPQAELPGSPTVVSRPEEPPEPAKD